MSNTDRQSAANAGKTNPTAKVTLEASTHLTPPDPFANIESLRLSQDYQSEVAVERVFTTVPVRKPKKQEFVRVHPDKGLRFETTLFEWDEDHEMYIVAPQMQAIMAPLAFPAILYTTVTRQGNVLLWPVKLPGQDGKDNSWHLSAREAAVLAMRRWVRITANHAINGYEVHAATGELAEPKWPTQSFEDILRLAFKDRIIRNPDHPVVKSLAGAE